MRDMIKQDDRTPEEVETHNVLVKARDSFMSGWGPCENGYSVAAWACRPEDADAVENWVRSRGEMKYVSVVGNDYRPPRGTAHYHIYVVKEGHRALGWR